MEKDKAMQAYLNLKDKVPAEKQIYLKDRIEKADDSTFDRLITVETHNHVVVLLMSIFFGAFGVDRFIIGDIGLGIAKLLLGWATFGIWPLIDIFLCYKKAKEKNLTNIISML